MSLARTLMNGGMIGVSIDPARYGHSMGATRIAMESVEELHEIFMESFYNAEQIELEAATEGVEVAGSKFESALEANNVSVLQRIKDFLKKLWEKVKAFFHNVKRFVSSVVMSGKDFAKKYKADIGKIKGLKDFEFEMYKYDDKRIDDVPSISDTEAATEAIFKGISASVDTAFGGKSEEEIQKAVKSAKDAFDDKWEDAIRGEYVGKSKVSSDDYDEELFKYFRNGASDAQDKEKREFSEVASLAKIMTDSKADSNLDKLYSKQEKVYKKAEKMITDYEKELKAKEGTKDNTKVQSAVSTICSEMTSAVSKVQSISNKLMSAWKTAYKERDAAYKSCIMAAFAHARRQK